jgi:hypothetical protein
MAAKGLGSFFGARGKDKAAEAQAKNANATNKWNWKRDKAHWQGERGWQHKKRGRSHAFRSQLLAGLMANPKYGLDKLFPGFAQLQQKYTPDKVINPYEAAGAPPQMVAAKGGLMGQLGAAAGGAADAGIKAYGIGRG